MSEELTNQQEVAAETSDSGLSEFMDKLTKSMDERYSGFQSLLDKKVGAIESTLEELRVSRMSPAEREEFVEEQVTKENARLKRENEILKKAKEHPEEVAFLTAFLEQQSLDAQLALLANFKGKPTPVTPTEADEGEEPEPEVNLNNPPRRPEQSLGNILASGRMTKEAAEKLLNANNERGALSRLRK